MSSGSVVRYLSQFLTPLLLLAGRERGIPGLLGTVLSGRPGESGAGEAAAEEEEGEGEAGGSTEGGLEEAFVSTTSSSFKKNGLLSFAAADFLAPAPLAFS